jgi:hypothetical protein
MLTGRVVRSSGEVSEGFNGAVKATFPAVEILPVGFIFNGSFGNSIWLDFGLAIKI